ncbi:MAG: hypothetical protein HC831_24970 [Chloroflexia bacterium]|nr:hypothetical protein [Chloroflexia bacterium]
MRLINKISNGFIIIIIGILHTNFGISDGFSAQFAKFSQTNYYKISRGLDELPAEIGKTNFEIFAAFWFFYFGILLIPLGFLVISLEKNRKMLPHSFTISYLIVILIGCYMIPNSGMTFIMLPHAVYMLIINYLKVKTYKKELQ